jgi:transposase
MRILVAIEAVDLRKGIDGLAELCREKLLADPFPAACLCFEAGARRQLNYCSMTVRDSFWHRNVSPRDALCGGRAASGPARVLEAYQAQLLRAVREIWQLPA